jgi:hypothetical protein
VKGAETPGPAVTAKSLQLRVRTVVDTATYFYSLDDGRSFQQLGQPVQAVFSWWKGARPALLAFSTDAAHAGGGYVDFDWAHYRALTAEEAGSGQ